MQIRPIIAIIAAVIFIAGCQSASGNKGQTQLQADVEAMRSRADFTMPRSTLDDWKLGLPKVKYDPWIVDRWDYYPWTEDMSGEWLLNYMDRECRYYALAKDMKKWEESQEPWVPKPSKYDKLLEKSGAK